MDSVRYYMATVMVAVAVAGLWLGGGWVWAGIAMFPILLVLDVILPPDHRMRHVRVPWLADAPLYLHLPLVLCLWTLFGLRLGAWSGHLGVQLPGGTVGAAGVVGMVLSVGLIGAIPGLPISHELMHRRARFPIELARVYDTFSLETNADIGHVLGHHLYLDTPADSDTPVRGQSIYSFMWQAWWGKRQSCWSASVNALHKRGKSLWHPKNPIYVEIGLLGVLFGLMYVAAGPAGVVLAVPAMVFSMLLAEGFNYLQHYGLVRVPGSPIELHHAWNHLGAIVRPLAMEITTHIEHHFDSRHKFYELKPRPEAPQMPSAILCFVCALIPQLWEKTIAKPRLRYWDEHFASPAERELAMAANRRAGWPEWVDTGATSTARTEARGAA